MKAYEENIFKGNWYNERVIMYIHTDIEQTTLDNILFCRMMVVVPF